MNGCIVGQRISLKNPVLVGVSGYSESKIHATARTKIPIAQPELRDAGVPPARASDDLVVAPCRPDRIDGWLGLSRICYRIDILHPFGNVSATVVEAKCVGGERANGGR